MKIIVTEEQINLIINNIYDNYINKDVPKPKKYGNVLSEEVIKPPNDEYAYKREGYNFYYAKVGKNNQPNSKSKWVQIKNEDTIRTIEKTIFKSNSGTYLKQGSSVSSKNWVGCKNGFENGSIKIIGTKPFTKGFFKVGEQVYVTGYKLSAVGKSINGYVKILKVDANLMGITIDKPWPPKVKGIQDECAKVQKIESNINANAKKCGWGADIKGYTQSGYLCPKPKKVAGPYPYAELKSWPTPQFIAKIIKDSNSVDDNELWAEAAFMAIKTNDMYNQVKVALGQDPYKYAASFMDVNEKYGTQSITTSYNTLSNGVRSDEIKNLDLSTGCPIDLSASRPGGGKQYLGPINYMKFFKGGVGTPGADPLLYSNGLTGTYGKVPDFGWNLNLKTYPYPKYYDQNCLAIAKQASEVEATKQSIDKKNQDAIDKKEYIQKRDTETTNVVRYQPPVLNFKNTLSLNESTNLGKDYQYMLNFNQSLSKQKELIPQYCKTPLKREWDASDGSGNYKFRMISMYNLCKDYGGLWVYGAGSSKYTCGCRDNSNPALTTAMKTDTGNFNAGKEIQKQQGSTNWGNVEARSVLWGAAALASAFIPVVGPFVAAGIGLGGAADLWTSNKHKEAAIVAFFSLLPLAGKIPGVGTISKALGEEMKAAVLNSGSLTQKELETLINIIKYDTQVSKAMIPTIEAQGLGKLEAHIIKTAIKKTEEKVIDLAGGPTYGGLKKSILKVGLEKGLS
jgi:hypothetical protein